MATSFKEAFRKFAGEQHSSSRATAALHHLVLPVAIGLLGAFTPALWDMQKLLPIVLWIFLTIFYGLSWWKSHPTYADASRLLLQKQVDDDAIHELNAGHELLQEIVDDLYFKNIAAFAMRSMSVDYIKHIRVKGLTPSYMSEMADELLAPFYLSGDAVFGFSISEKWSLGIYIFHEESQTLKSIWRKTSPTHPSKDRLGREWLPGEGHVGKAFLDRRPILTGNANDEAVAQLCRARASKMEAHDSSTYVSFASVPIAVAADDKRDPYGVLVVSSSEEDRLSEESVTELLMHAAETIAVILELSDTGTDCLFEPNHATIVTQQGSA